MALPSITPSLNLKQKRAGSLLGWHAGAGPVFIYSLFKFA